MRDFALRYVTAGQNVDWCLRIRSIEGTTVSFFIVPLVPQLAVRRHKSEYNVIISCRVKVWSDRCSSLYCKHALKTWRFS
jgi:hypothetical protein